MVLACAAMVCLVAVVAARMLLVRIAEMKAGRIHPQAVANSKSMGERLQNVQAADNYRNLFEMPVLFYLACALAITLNLATPVLAALAWIYVALRMVHSAIHCTYNKVMHRLTAFAASCAVLVFIWVTLVMKVLG
jgi:hypothetical protein